MNDTYCPYCDTGIDIDHDDGQGYEEDIFHEQECLECKKTFTFCTSISFSYKASEADCLNGAPHRFSPSSTTLKLHTKMWCLDCEEKRNLTDQEWLNFMKPMEVISGWYK